jgi:hypothetical protein
MARRKKISVADDNALRAFYEACGVSPTVIEGAIKTRYEEPTSDANREKAIEQMRATGGKWSKKRANARSGVEHDPIQPPIREDS